MFACTAILWSNQLCHRLVWPPISSFCCHQPFGQVDIDSRQQPTGLSQLRTHGCGTTCRTTCMTSVESLSSFCQRLKISDDFLDYRFHLICLMDLTVVKAAQPKTVAPPKGFMFYCWCLLNLFFGTLRREISGLPRPSRADCRETLPFDWKCMQLDNASQIKMWLT